MTETFSLAEVFTPGGRPTVTYNPRSDLRLEDRVQDYLDERYRILSVSGPTKTGKTVLLKSVLPDDAIWLHGGSFTTEEEFWTAISDHLGLFTEYETQSGSIDQQSGSGKGGLGIGVAQVGYQRTSTSGWTQSERLVRKQQVKSPAREALRGSAHVIVIDDFHYLDPSVQQRIVRSVKDLVFDGLGVIVAAVPHRAYDVVRVEKEMTGRVQQLEIGFWAHDELLEIAAKGFAALRAKDEGGRLAQRLAEESFQSPHLMQEFCRELCKVNEIRHTLSSPVVLHAPDWETLRVMRKSL